MPCVMTFVLLSTRMLIEFLIQRLAQGANNLPLSPMLPTLRRTRVDHAVQVLLTNRIDKGPNARPVSHNDVLALTEYDKPNLLKRSNRVEMINAWKLWQS